MSAFNFPASPAVGTKYPDPGVPGIPVYIWDGEKWTTYGGPGISGGVPGMSLPKMDGTATVGVSTAYSREDHVHPSNTSKVEKSGDTMTGPLSLPGDPVADLQAATKQYVDHSVIVGGGASPSNAPPGMDGIATPGLSALFSRGDHIHPTDTSRQPADGDLTAVAALSGTGIARRTSTVPLWTTGDLVLNMELAQMPAFSFKGNNLGGPGQPIDVDIAALPTKASPAGGDFLLLSDQAASGSWKKLAINTLPGASGGVSEAPNDGKQYGRQSLGWTQVTGGGATPSDAIPAADSGSGSAGTSLLLSRGDHVHPIDTSRAPIASPVFTGDARCVTASPGDADTSIATTAFVAAAITTAASSAPTPGTANPVINGIAAPGAATAYSREDHVHPTDTTRAPLSAIPAAATVAPVMDGTAAVGVSTKFTREDHVHPTDTSRAAVSALPVAATAAEYLSNSAPTKMLTSGATWGAAAAANLSDAASVTPNFGTAIDFYYQIVGINRTFNNPTNAKDGQKGVFYIVQGAGGGCTISTWGSMYKFTGGIKPTLSTPVGSVDIMSYVVGAGGGVVYCSFAADYK